MSITRIAMWSGPRNISTAMMRSFENRPDTDVWDEPFYGYYLHQTGIAHPGADEIIADQGIDWQDIARRCCGNPPGNAAIFYQKHMTMHLLPEMGVDWLSGLINCFLIRQPDQVAASYAAVREDLTLNDIGFIQQAELFDHVHAMSGSLPIVIDSKDFLQNPAAMLENFCEQLGIPFTDQMLSWLAGKRASDGVWGKYWYDTVWQSTGFSPYVDKATTLDHRLQKIADAAEPYYHHLHQHRLTV